LRQKQALCSFRLDDLIDFMEIGIYTFADLGTHPQTGEAVTPQQRMRNLLEEAELADQVGLDVFAVGEHHRPIMPFRRRPLCLQPLQNAPNEISFPVPLRC
jgi:alkanesulfonate monooxygenase SsuD/methylene tetrahydromethanopterin reductase-like flavin-dependent oxidoreductase (luciferase family)